MASRECMWRPRAVHLWLCLAMLAAAWAWPMSASARELSDKALTSGFAIGTGLGWDNVVLGGHVLQYLQLRSPRARFALHAGVGGVGFRDTERALGVVGGVFFAYGKRNRLIVGVNGGTMDWRLLTLYGESVRYLRHWGAYLGLGYELLTRRGFFLRATVGPGFSVSPATSFDARETRRIWRGNLLSIGWKLW